MWTLKKNQPAFEIVDGPAAGRKFRHGEQYAEVPEREQHRFERHSEKKTSQIVVEETPVKRGKKQEEVADAQ